MNDVPPSSSGDEMPSDRATSDDAADAVDAYLVALIGQARVASDPVPAEAIEAARVIADLEMLDAELAALVEHEETAGVRSGSDFVVRFRLGGAEIAVHTAAAGARVEGTVYDLDVSSVALRHASGLVHGHVLAPEFTIESVPQGSCRLEFTTAGGVVATDWFVIG